MILAAPPMRSSLAGAEAAIESFGYTYRGVGDVEVDLLAGRDGDVFLLELKRSPRSQPRAKPRLKRSPSIGAGSSFAGPERLGAPQGGRAKRVGRDSAAKPPRLGGSVKR